MNPVPDSQAGWTWDGGPRPQSPLLAFAPFPVGRSQPLVVARIGSRSVTQDCQRLEQVPKLESSDEGSVAVASIADREFQGSVWQVENVSAAALISGFFHKSKNDLCCRRGRHLGRCLRRLPSSTRRNDTTNGLGLALECQKLALEVAHTASRLPWSPSLTE